ncbi:hypothetical protein BDZ89DRAFT_889960, partial [Hymenopellis radicata]
TINQNPHLFHVGTPINVSRLESLLTVHPNQSFCASVMTSLREGFWPWAETKPTDDYPVTWDNAWATFPTTAERDFVNAQCEEEVELKRHSPVFGPDLLPGMYSTPNIAVPKPHSDDLRMVANQSAGEFSQNTMVDKSKTRGARMDSLLIFIPILLAFVRTHPGKEFVLWKSDVKAAFRLIPMHPLWQIKQVVTANMPTTGEAHGSVTNKTLWQRYVDWMACFGNSGSPRAWASVMGLVVWIAIFVAHIVNLCCYVDDCYSIALVGDTQWYEPYGYSFPSDQVKLLKLWDHLGIPHKRLKQEWGRTLTVIGFFIDPNKLTATLPADSKLELLNSVRAFAASRRRTLAEFQKLAGWINWSLNVFPLFKLGLCNVYNKMEGKSRAHAQIYLNKAITEDLTWFAAHVEKSSGMLFFANLDWNPTLDYDLCIYCDACLEGMGFWIPALNLGFFAPVDDADMPGADMRERIFYWEALCVLSALHWFSLSPLSQHGRIERPSRLTVMCDNTNTVDIFSSLRALPAYNRILQVSVDLRVQSNIDLRVVHLPGIDNTVADAISRSESARAVLHAPDLVLGAFQLPRSLLGAAK